MVIGKLVRDYESLPPSDQAVFAAIIRAHQVFNSPFWRAEIDRRKLVASLQCLTADPAGAGISEAIDSGGRTNRIAVVGCHSFVFWVDHAIRRIRVLAIRSMAD